MLNYKNYNNLFKTCPNCGFEWNTRDHFLLDPTLEIIGYQVNFIELTSGLFYFNHDCRGTLTIRAGAFKELYDGPLLKTRATGSEECPGYCLHKEELGPCPAKCECSYVREIIKTIKDFENNKKYSLIPNSNPASIAQNHLRV